jgi:thioredoxin reductase
VPTNRLPVAVIGAGPIGLAAAAHLLARGERPTVLEAGNQIGANLADWRHVRLFSPWCLALDPAAVRLLTATGWTPPDPDELPTGGDLLDRYLLPLAALPAIAGRVQLDHRVVGIARQGLDKVRSPGRDQLPFVLRIHTPHGEHDLAVRAVIDASGTWTQPNPLGANGLPALGEHAARDRIVTGLPDVLGADRHRFTNRRVLVIGAGHSAATSLLALAELRRQAPATRIVWAVRSATLRPLVGKGSAQADELPARGQLATDLRAVIDGGHLELLTGFGTSQLRSHPKGVTVSSVGAASSKHTTVDLIVNATGFRPDHAIARELRLGLDPALESVAALAPLIDPNVHTCGSVPAHGASELAHPEPGYYIIGIKSYGRAPTFLLATGYEQVRSVAAALTGDQAAADTIPAEQPAARFCRITRELLASSHGRRPLLGHGQAQAILSTQQTPSTSDDWGTVTCCP